MPKQYACLCVCFMGLSVDYFLHKVIWFYSSLEHVCVTVSLNMQPHLSLIVFWSESRW